MTGGLTELADVVIGVGLRHGSDGEQGAGVAAQGFAQDVLPEIDAGGPQGLQFGKVHLNEPQTDVNNRVSVGES